MIPIARWVAPFGYPRIKACSRLPMAFRSVPRPSSPPGAKASTECPYRAPSQMRASRLATVNAHQARSLHTMHRNHRRTSRPAISLASLTHIITQHLTNAPDHCRRIKRDDPRLAPRSLPVRQITQCRNGLPCSRPQRQPPSRPAHPGAHQNQIYNTNEQTEHGANRPPHALGGGATAPMRNLSHEANHASAGLRPTPRQRTVVLWKPLHARG